MLVSLYFGWCHIIFVMVWACKGPALPLEPEFADYHLFAVITSVLCVLLFVVFVHCPYENAGFCVWFFSLGLLSVYLMSLPIWLGWNEDLGQIDVFGQFTLFAGMAEKHPEFACWFRTTITLWPLCVLVCGLLELCAMTSRAFVSCCFGLLHFVFVMTWVSFGPALPVEPEFVEFWKDCQAAFVLCIALFVTLIVGIPWAYKERVGESVACFVWVFVVPLAFVHVHAVLLWFGLVADEDGRFFRFAELVEKHPEFVCWFRTTIQLWPLCVGFCGLLEGCTSKIHASREVQHQILA